MDRLPDELLELILEYAMIRAEPLILAEFTRASNAHKDDIQKDPQKSKAKKVFGCPKSPADKMHATQRPHYRDWLAVSGTCQRVRGLGKPAFFSNKTFVMDYDFVDKLQNCKARQLSNEDQQMAKSCIRSIMLIEAIALSTSSFMKLPRRISQFPRFESLYHIFGYRSGDSVDLLIRATRDKRPAPSELIDALASLGVPTRLIKIGIMVAPNTDWSTYENQLRSYTCPMLRVAASMKAKKDASFNKTSNHDGA